MAPAATDSLAEPMVCTMLFSRMESLLRITRITPMEITAAGGCGHGHTDAKAQISIGSTKENSQKDTQDHRNRGYFPEPPCPPV